MNVVAASGQTPSVAHFTSAMAAITGHGVPAGLIDARENTGSRHMILGRATARARLISTAASWPRQANGRSAPLAELGMVRSMADRRGRRKNGGIWVAAQRPFGALSRTSQRPLLGRCRTATPANYGLTPTMIVSFGDRLSCPSSYQSPATNRGHEGARDRHDGGAGERCEESERGMKPPLGFRACFFISKDRP